MALIYLVLRSRCVFLEVMNVCVPFFHLNDEEDDIKKGAQVGTHIEFAIKENTRGLNNVV